MLIADVLRGKSAGPALATTAPSATVGELLGLLAQYNVGALPVVDGGELVGIVSERDVVRQLHERGHDLLDATRRRHHERGRRHLLARATGPRTSRG